MPRTAPTDRPLDVAVLVYPGCMGVEAFAMADVLLIANRLAGAGRSAPGRAPPFSVRLVTARQEGPVRVAGGHAIHAARLGRTPDVLVIPGLELQLPGEWDDLLAALKPECTVLRRAARLGAALAGVCLGSFLMAEAGLLDRRRATTAWPFAGEFAFRYPQVRVDPDAVIVEDGPALTSGAVSSAFDLSLRLVERRCGARLARATGKLALLHAPRASQQPYTDRSLMPAAATPFAKRAQDWLAARLAEPYRMDALAAALHVSSRTLLRRFRDEAGTTPLAWLQSARMQRAAELLEGSGCAVLEAAHSVGYGDLPTFSRLFTRLRGETPSACRQRHRRPRGVQRA